ALRTEACWEALRIAVFGLIVWAAYNVIGDRLLYVFFRSSSLDPADTARLCRTVGWMLLGLGPMSALPYLFRVYYSLREYKWPAIVGISVAAGYALMAQLLLAHWQILALAISYVTIWWLAFVSSMIHLRRSEGYLPALAH